MNLVVVLTVLTSEKYEGIYQACTRREFLVYGCIMRGDSSLRCEMSEERVLYGIKLMRWKAPLTWKRGRKKERERDTCPRRGVGCIRDKVALRFPVSFVTLRMKTSIYLDIHDVFQNEITHLCSAISFALYLFKL